MREIFIQHHLIRAVFETFGSPVHHVTIGLGNISILVINQLVSGEDVPSVCHGDIAGCCHN